jgi:hypothetical protein
MVREGRVHPTTPLKEPYPAEKARGGTIILNTPARFIAGLVGAVLLVVILGIFART